MKLYLEGGADIQKGNVETINKIIKGTKKPRLLMIQWTSKNKKENLKYRKIFSKYFKSLNVEKILFAEFKDSRKELKEKVEKCNLIYLPGGDPKILYETIKRKKIINLLKNFKGTIFGGSAGALVQCKRYAIIKGQDNKKQTKLEPGIGLTNITISVHYHSKNPALSGKDPENELKKLSKKLNKRIYAIPEKSVIEIREKELKFHGPVYVFYKGKRSKAPQQTKTRQPGKAA